jgi:hypothetical protein
MDLESRMRLDAHAEAVRDFARGHGGDLVTQDDGPVGLYWLVLAQGDDAFIARIAWQIYPDAAPSVLFASAVGGGTVDPKHWPMAAGFRAPNDICKPFTAEGQALHPEWAGAWRREGNPFLWVAETLHADMTLGGWRRAA